MSFPGDAFFGSMRRVAAVALMALVAVVAAGCGGAECGDGEVEDDEQCDDGNERSGDGCSDTCQIENPNCGNGVRDDGEQCDDGNRQGGDGCSASCQLESCGDGVLDFLEACDDGNLAAGDGCGPDCMTEGICGNGIADGDEPCDDGNDVPYDGCEADCTVSPDEIVCAELAPAASGACDVTAGGAHKLLRGAVLLEHTILRGGQVAVDASGQITCAGCDCAAEAAGATVLHCPGAVISPGLINAHDHITYIQNPPYNDTGERYEHRHDWRRGQNGHTEIPSAGGASDVQINWGELRFLMGGATSTIGSGSAAGLLRNLDRNDQEGLNQPPVNYSTFPLDDAGGTRRTEGCFYGDIDSPQSIAGDDAYFPHVSEGIDATARNEFLCLSGAQGGENVLLAKSAFIHSIGLTPLDYARMATAGTTLVWSPRSNITLYGDTAVVTAAARLGVNIALGTDWVITGSMNLQRELRCASDLNQRHYGGYFTDRQLWQMVTINAARASATDDVIGALRPGKSADIAIFDASLRVDHRAVMDAGAQDVVLVMRGGQVLYGDAAVVGAMGSAPGCDPVPVCGRDKQVCLQGDIGRSYQALASANSSRYPAFFCGEPDNEPSCEPRRTQSVQGSTVYGGGPAPGDGDGDGIGDDVDNCPAVFNPVRPLDGGQQGDFDFDGAGDACDVCPLQANVTDCAPYTGVDEDADGVPNAQDNCPQTPNPDQADGDGDGKGDVCDPCPTVANPGNLGCPTTIYAIKKGEATGTVALENQLVTACIQGVGFVLQAKQGDPGYAGANHSAVYVYHPPVQCGQTLRRGDRVTLQPASVNLFGGQIQLGNATITVLSQSGEASPPAEVIAPSAAGGSAPPPLEAALVRVEGVLVTEVEPADADAGLFVVEDEIGVGNLMHTPDPMPVVGVSYDSITGVLLHRFGRNKLEPRDAADLEPGPPVLVGFGPQPAFVRVGDVGETTIPEPLLVQLSTAVESPTFVAVTSSNESALSAEVQGAMGTGVVVPAGMASAAVRLDGKLQAAAVTLTATLDTRVREAMVRVVGADELPKVVDLTPPAGFVAPGGTLELTVHLDIPVAVATPVPVTLVPGTFLSAPSTVTVETDRITAVLALMGVDLGSEQVTVSLNGGQASSLIDVQEGGGLIINEVDYDQVGSDADEFVEILNATSTALSLEGLALVFINGADGEEYRRVDLGSAGDLAGGAYLVVGSDTLLASLPAGPKTIALPFAENNIQNGAPDALGILDTATGMLVDALSYEGDVTAGQVVGVGALDFTEGDTPDAGDSNDDDGSLCRLPNGNDTDDAKADWKFSTTPTPGAANVP